MMELTQGQRSAVLISEGRCWECQGQLERRDDGWGECLRCDRRMKVQDGTVHEMIRLEPHLPGKTVELSSGVRVMDDNGTVLLSVPKTGRAKVKLSPRAVWLELSFTTAPLGAQCQP